MGLLKKLKEFRFVRTVNVIYIDQEGTGEMLFVERDFAYNLPNKGDAVIYNGQHFRVGTRWFDMDNDFIEIDLTDL